MMNRKGTSVSTSRLSSQRTSTTSERGVGKFLKIFRGDAKLDRTAPSSNKGEIEEEDCLPETTTHSQSSSYNSRGRSCPSMLEELAREGKWNALVDLVAKSHPEDWEPKPTSDSSSANDNTNKEIHRHPTDSLVFFSNPLHLILPYRPPLHVIDSLIALLKDETRGGSHVLVPEESQDNLGRTPLHIAVMHHCDEDTAERLLTGENLLMPAVLRDHLLRTPLHWASCVPVPHGKDAKKENQCKHFWSQRRFTPAQAKWNKRCVLAVLTRHYPEAVVLKDVHGKTPIDYIHENAKSINSESTLREITRLGALHAIAGNPEEKETDQDIVWNGRYVDQRDQPGDEMSSVGDHEAEMFNVPNQETG